MNNEKRIRGFIVEKKIIKCRAFVSGSAQCYKPMQVYCYKGTDIIAEKITCSREGCSNYNEKIEYLNDGKDYLAKFNKTKNNKKKGNNHE